MFSDINSKLPDKHSSLFETIETTTSGQTIAGILDTLVRTTQN
jgi:hypothetical protein